MILIYQVLENSPFHGLIRKLLKEGHRSFQLFDPVVLCSMWNQRKVTYIWYLFLSFCFIFCFFNKEILAWACHVLDSCATNQDMLQNQLMFEGYYMQTFSQMEGKSHYNRWSSWSWLVLQKPSTIQIFKWQQGEWWAYRTADSCLESRVESLIQNSNSEFSVCYKVHLFFFFGKELHWWMNISNSFSGDYITDEWTRLHPDLMSLPLEDENKIISRMDHKGKRNVIDIYAGILRLWFFMLFHTKKELFWHSMKLFSKCICFFGIQIFSSVEVEAILKLLPRHCSGNQKRA